MSRWLRIQWDRSAAWGCVALGALLLVVGWYGMSGKALAEQQLPYLLSGGLGGLFLLGLGSALLLSADLRDEWRKLDAIEEALRTGGASTRGAEPAEDPDVRPLPIAADVPTQDSAPRARRRRAAGTAALASEVRAP